MTIRLGHKQIVRALLLLFVFTAAYAGKSLHTHSAEYYLSQRADTSAGAGFIDDCPICHFHLFVPLPAEQLALAIFFVLLGTAPVEGTPCGSVLLPAEASLRAPPAAV